MAIQVTCSNGHILSVRDDMAGKAGLCPACKATVRVPQPRCDDFEDSICDVLNTPGARRAWPTEANDGTDTSPEPVRYSGAKKICFKCHREIAAGNHICPFCHTYIAKLADF